MTAKKLLCGLLLAALSVPLAGAADWRQWGGPHRNFTTEAPGLADSWPEGGPEQVWSRELGEGYSAVVVEGDRIYTMYRVPAGLLELGKEDQEAIIAMDAATGETVWEVRYDAPELPGMQLEYGPGPHSTPLIVGDRLFAVGAGGKMHALDKRTGEHLWSKDFYKEYGVVWRRGYSCSPLAYQDSVLLSLGVEGGSLLALRQSDGKELWRKHDFRYGPSSPILIDVDGQEQAVFFMAAEIVGVAPKTGELLWTHPHATSYGLNITTPVWGEDGILFVSSAYNGGSRAVRLSRPEDAGGKTRVEELWFNNRMRIHIGTAIRVGDTVYGSSGDFSAVLLSAVDIHSGEVLWRSREFARASGVYADGKMILVDEDGLLVLTRVSRQGVEVLGRAEALKSNAWTPPTLAGTRLYVRDRARVYCFDLS